MTVGHEDIRGEISGFILYFYVKYPLSSINTEETKKKGREILHSVHEKVTKRLNLNIELDNRTQNRILVLFKSFRFISSL